MNLFKDENIITRSDDHAVTLTTHRIRSDFGTGGEAKFTSIMLEHVSSVQLSSRNYPILIAIGIILLLVGIIFGNSGYRSSGSATVPIVAGVGIILSYFFIKQHTCIIAADGGSKIEFSTTGMRKEALIAFLDKVEEAQLKRTQVTLV